MLSLFRDIRAERVALRDLRAMQSGEWVCSCCGQTHTGLQDIGFQSPDPWPHEQTYKPNSELNFEGDFLSEDFCVMNGRDFFVRTVLLLPIQKLDCALGVGVWSTLSEESFREYIVGFDDPDANIGSEYFSWLANRIPFLNDKELTKTYIVTLPDRQRPYVKADPDSQAGLAQSDGLSPQMAIELYSLGGHSP